jgi:GntR family transcriptional repressor for pyruvate dehydrogenase complex
MRTLGAMGLVDVSHGSGAYVVDRTAELAGVSLLTYLQIQGVSIFDVLDLRELLGSYSMRRAVDRATAADIKAVGRALDAIDAIHEPPSGRVLADRVVAFQVAISSATHDNLIVTIEMFLIRLLMDFQIAAYGNRDGRFWRQWTSVPGPARRRIYELLTARDADGAVQAMEMYLDVQRTSFAEHSELSSITLSDPRWVDAIAADAQALAELR